MRLTDEQVMQDNKRFANCNALAELKYCGLDIPHRKSITNDEIHFYAWLCRSAVTLLKAQKEEIDELMKLLKYPELHNLVRCKDCDNRECDGRAGTIVCGITGESHSRLWFCADGERKDQH